MADGTEMSAKASVQDSDEVALMQACEGGKPEVVKMLLDRGVSMKHEYTAIEDGEEKKYYETCLDVAIDHDKENVAEEIIKHQRWKESLKIFPGKKNDTHFRNLIKKMPDTATKVLDQCVTQHKSRKSEFIIDFEILEEFQEQDIESAESSVRDSMRIHVLELMENHLLLHPVVLTLLRWKWLHYMGYIFFINLILYLIFLTFLTSFALVVPNPLREVCRGVEYNRTNASDGSESALCGMSSGRRSFLIAAAVITIISSLVRLLVKGLEVMELVRVIKGPDVICKIIDWSYLTTYMEIPQYVLSIAFVSVFQHECLCPSRGQWRAGIFAVFFAWIDLIFYLNKWPLIGIYIQMLLSILKNFVKVLIVASLLLFAFDLAFYMAFYEPGLSDSPFENPGITFIQVISYTIASPDVSILRLSKDSSTTKPISYPGMSYLTWVVFAVIMSVLFLNLLIGLAVEDVQKLRGEAQQNRIKEQIRMLRDAEKWIKALRPLCSCKKRFHIFDHRSPRSDTITKQPYYWRNINAFIGDEIEDILDKASEVLKRKEKWMKE